MQRATLIALAIVGGLLLTGGVLCAILLLCPALWYASDAVEPVEELEARLPKWDAAWPKVSVIIPTFERAHVIARSVRSALTQRQSYLGSLDVLVVNDGGAQEKEYRATLATEWQHELDSGVLRYVRLPRNQGQSAARNRALQMVDGEMVAFLDDDDEWLPRKLHVQILSMLVSGIGFSCTDGYKDRMKGRAHFARTGATYHTCTPDMSVHFGRGGFPDRFSRKDLARINAVLTSSVVAERALLLKAGAFDTDLSHAEDWDLWLRVLREMDRGLFVRTPLVVYDMTHGGERQLWNRSARARKRSA